jgi:predicted acylesterase/phospholipase RssA
MRCQVALLLLAVTGLAGCSFIPLYSYNNQESDQASAPVPRPVQNLYRAVSLRPMLPANVSSGASKASIANVPWQISAACRSVAVPQSRASMPEHCRDDRFVALAISGGGSRASIFGAAVMFELQRYGLLQHVDLVSCVSGGCLTAAYYALSCDDPEDKTACPPTTNGAARYAWREETVYPLLERNLIWRWFGNWFWPDNIVKFWFTHFDRTDIMADTISHNLYDQSILDNNQFRFRDLNPNRPNLAINATNVTAGPSREFPFAFSPEQFQKLHSDLDRYPIANAVMASASFPGAFNYVTLRDFREKQYVHLLDGGAYDNLGLNAIRTAMETRTSNTGEPKQRVVIIIDAYMSLDNSMARQAEPRSWTDYVIDSNFFVAYDTLLTSLRSTQLQFARTVLKQHGGTLLHISWENLDKDGDPQHAWLGNRLNRIPTSLNITSKNADRLRSAAKILVEKELKQILCDPSRHADAQVVRPMLSPQAPALSCG